MITVCVFGVGLGTTKEHACVSEGMFRYTETPGKGRNSGDRPGLETDLIMFVVGSREPQLVCEQERGRISSVARMNGLQFGEGGPS